MRRLITMSWNAEYWNARNLAIELANLNYPNVYWYRGGLEAWDAAGLPTVSNRAGAIADYDEEIRLHPNSAAAYYQRGEAYRAMGHADRAIADLSEAIKLDPKLARAYNNRGLAYVAKDNFHNAVADFTAAIQLDPTFTDAYIGRARARRLADDDDGAIADASEAIRLSRNQSHGYLDRGNSYLAKGDLDHAIADYNETIRRVPNSDEAFFGRGRAYFYRGDFTKAQTDFQRAVDLSANFFRGALWLDIAERRGKLPRRLEQAASRLNMTVWPAPVVHMLLGDLTPAQLLAAADDKDPAIRRGKICQANFYSGELALSENAREEASRLFRLAAAECPPSDIERQGAMAELKAFGSVP